MTDPMTLVVTKQLIEKRYNLSSRQALTYALLPSVLNLPTTEALVVSMALGARNEVPPPPPPSSDKNEDGVAAAPGTGSRDVPDVRNLTVREAEERLRRSGFVVDKGKHALTATVTGQTPEAGTPAAPGTTVRLEAAA